MLFRSNCNTCGAYVGCHKGTQVPMGRMANFELRKLRDKAHKIFDPIWKDGKMSRKEAYRWLMAKLGVTISNCHIAEFDDALCLRVIEVCASLVCNVCGKKGEPDRNGNPCGKLLCYRSCPLLCAKELKKRNGGVT